ncbi:hypothetical protein STEG23_035655 [Scotinomys teguina]
MDFTEDLANMGGGIEEQFDAGEKMYYSYTVESGERWCLESKVLNKISALVNHHERSFLLQQIGTDAEIHSQT